MTACLEYVYIVKYLKMFFFSGIFTCPVTGVYLFSYMVNTFVRDYQLVVKLVIDGINMSDGTSDPYHNGQVKYTWWHGISLLFPSIIFYTSRLEFKGFNS